MELHFLGTSSGAPSKTRNVSATVVKASDSKHWCLVDCGEATQHQLLHSKLSLHKLQAIFITHVHGDHCYGLFGLLASAALHGRTAPLYLVAPAAIQQLVQVVQTLTQTHLSYELRFVDVENLNDAELELELSVAATSLSHRVPSYAYSFEHNADKAKLDIAKLKSAGIPASELWGQLQQGQDIEYAGQYYRAHDYLLPSTASQKIVIAGDNDTPECLIPLLDKAQVVVHEATYTVEVQRKVGTAPMHCTAQAIAEFATQQQLTNLVLTHFSPRYQDDLAFSPSIADIAAEARQQYQGQLYLAKDFDIYRLDNNGILHCIGADQLSEK